jgi:melibiose permease/lactose/raffinose/galactose permease
VQPLINKIGGALSTAVVSLTLIIAGIKIDGGTVDAIGSAGKLMMKVSMFALPLVFIVAGYIIYLKKYKISETFYGEIIRDLEEREKEKAR